jgi:SAM-dependent MidA family methyltransferase
LRERVQWLERLPNAGFRGLVLGNELLDAMPVERFIVSEHGPRQLLVRSGADGFAWLEGPARDDIEARIAPLALPPGYVSEIGFAAEAWVRTVADVLTAGVVLLIDYGFPRTEYYHPERAHGTLMCHYRHRSHDDPLILVGLQDITAHIDFSAIAEAGHDAGLAVLGYNGQGAFLLASGLADIATQSDPSDVRAHLVLTEQVKKLTLPHEMGELFKVMALGRGFDERLRGFTLLDRRGRLFS